MISFTSNGSRSTKKYLCSGCFIVVLAIAVFGWGLHSKLSLYRVDHETTISTPIAKLLSEQERPSVDRSARFDTLPADLSAIVLPIATAPTPLFITTYRARRDDSPVKPIAFRFDGPSLLRPPPFAFFA